MKKTIALTGLALGLALITPAHAESSKQAEIYKHPQCGCCANYAVLMERAGYEVTIHNTEEVMEITEAAGIPDDYQGCHLTKVGGYAFSGHVPLTVLDQVLAEQPLRKAYALPGMPMGSPGMGGAKEEPFRVLSFMEGKPRVYAVE